MLIWFFSNSLHYLLHSLMINKLLIIFFFFFLLLAPTLSNPKCLEFNNCKENFSWSWWFWVSQDFLFLHGFVSNKYSVFFWWRMWKHSLPWEAERFSFQAAIYMWEQRTLWALQESCLLGKTQWHSPDLLLHKNSSLLETRVRPDVAILGKVGVTAEEKEKKTKIGKCA